MNLAESLKKERKKKNLSQKEFADKLGMNARTYASYERGERDISTAVLLNICKTLNISSDDLLGNSKNPSTSQIQISFDNMEPVPLVGAVAAGQGCFADDNISEYIPTDRDILKEGYEHFWLEVKGDSMEPELHEKDLVLVRKQDTLDKECFAVVNVDAEDGVVKLVNIETERITLTSLNRYYPPRVFVREEMNRVRLIGPVLEVKRRFM